MNIKDITPEDIEEIKNKDIAKPVIMSKLSDTLLYSGVFMVDNEPGMVKVKESELRMVLEELKKVKNLQVAQQKLVTEQNRVYLKAELEKTQKALEETVNENIKLRKQNEGLQRRVDELEYRFVEAKMTDMKRIDEAMEEDVIEKTVNSNSKKPQPKAALMLLQESREENAAKETFKSIVEADKEKRLNNDNDGFGDEELETKERKETPKLGRVDQMNITRANIIVMYMKGYNKAEIGKHLGVSHMTVYRALSISNGEVMKLFERYKQIFIDISLDDVLKWEPTDKTKFK